MRQLSRCNLLLLTISAMLISTHALANAVVSQSYAITESFQLPSISSIQIFPTSFEMAVGETRRIAGWVSIYPPDAMYPGLKWTSSNPTVASIDEFEGRVTAHSAGNATFTVEVIGNNRFNATCQVTVTAPNVDAEYVEISPSKLNLIVNQNSQLNVIVFPSNATLNNVSWEVGNASVATVSDNGLVTAISAGNAIVIFTANDGDISATCSVSVTAPDPARELEVRAFVKRFYRVCLLREAEEEGLAAWTALLMSGEMSGRDMGYGVIASQEFLNRNLNNEDFLSVCYAAFFDREPDEGGFNGWLRILNEINQPRALPDSDPNTNVYDGFAYSQEFVNLCMRFNIRPY